MRVLWMCFVIAILGGSALPCYAQEVQWRTAQPRPGNGTAAAVQLGRPTPLDGSAAAPAGQPASTAVPSFRQIVRGQSPDLFNGYPPPPQPPPPPPPPVVSPEPYNCAQANKQVVRSGFGSGTFLGDVPAAVGGFFAPADGRALFQSDHKFDSFLSPVSNPFYFEDPRALTEIKPLFMYQHVPGSNAVPNGNIWFVGLQGRVALTDRLSFVFSKFGYTWLDVNAPNANIQRGGGFSEVFLGPQYTFIRSDATCTLLAAGLSFDVATGSHRVFQDTGTLSLRPYVSFGQGFKTGIGDFNFLNTTGVSIATDNQRTDLFFSSFHVDYDVAGWHKLYPLIELNWFNYLRNGHANNFGTEGRDLINFGSTGVAGHNNVSLAVGARYKFSECIQVGGTFEFPLVTPHYLLDYRVTLDVIFRY